MIRWSHCAGGAWRPKRRRKNKCSKKHKLSVFAESSELKSLAIWLKLNCGCHWARAPVHRTSGGVVAAVELCMNLLRPALAFRSPYAPLPITHSPKPAILRARVSILATTCVSSQRSCFIWGYFIETKRVFLFSSRTSGGVLRSQNSRRASLSSPTPCRRRHIL